MREELDPNNPEYFNVAMMGFVTLLAVVLSPFWCIGKVVSLCIRLWDRGRTDR